MLKVHADGTRTQPGAAREGQTKVKGWVMPRCVLPTQATRRGHEAGTKAVTAVLSGFLKAQEDSDTGCGQF